MPLSKRRSTLRPSASYCCLHPTTPVQLLGFRIVRRLGVRRGGQPTATVVFASASVVVFALTHNLARIVPSARGSLRPSALDGYSLWGRDVAEWGEWWRIVTGTFLHADLRHLLFNMLVLYLLGRRLERFIGPALLAGTYVVSLIGGSAGALLLRPDAVVVGASGAVYGLMGAAYVVEYLRGGNPWAGRVGQPHHRQRGHLVPHTRHFHRRSPGRTYGWRTRRLGDRGYQTASRAADAGRTALGGGRRHGDAPFALCRVGLADSDWSRSIRGGAGGCKHLEQPALLATPWRFLAEPAQLRERRRPASVRIPG